MFWGTVILRWCVVFLLLLGWTVMSGGTRSILRNLILLFAQGTLLLIGGRLLRTFQLISFRTACDFPQGRWLSSILYAVTGRLSRGCMRELPLILIILNSLNRGCLHMLRVNHGSYRLHNPWELLVLYTLICIYIQSPNHSNYLRFLCVVAWRSTEMQDCVETKEPMPIHINRVESNLVCPVVASE